MRGQIDPGFWGGKRVLVTGHTGFKGAWLTLLLTRLGCKVWGLSLPPEEMSLFNQARLSEILQGSHYVDLEDGDEVRSVVDSVQPHVTVHLAAQSLVRDAYRLPRRTFATNVLGTVHLLEAHRTCQAVGSVLLATTDKVYLNLERGVPFREGDRLGGLEPYSASKVGAEMAASAYRASYFRERGVAVPVCRAGNVIGGGDWSDERLLPDAIRAVMSGENLPVRNPASARPWQFVLDALEGYLLLIQAGPNGGDGVSDPENDAWNFGPSAASEPVTVEQICQWIGEFWPDRFSWRSEADPERIPESKLLALDPAKAEARLNWAPRCSPKEAILRSLEWYSEFLAGKDAYDLCLRQIGEHCPELG